MIDSSSRIKAIIIFALVIPLALILGYSLATPLDFSTLAILGSILALLCLPWILRWHHFLLFLSWNLGALVFFLPGRPEFWIFMTLISFFITLVQRAVSGRLEMTPPAFIMWPLFFLLAVVLVTGRLRGGIGFSSMGGGTAGGRHYIYIIFAIIGFIAMSTHKIPKNRAWFFAGTYQLASLTTLIGMLVPVLGSSASLLFAIFPVDMSTYTSQMTSSDIVDQMGRYYALAVGLSSLSFFIFMRYSLRQLLQSQNLPKLFLALACFSGSLMGGFRTSLIAGLLTLFFIFILEGLHRGRYVLLPILSLCGLLFCLPFARHLPMSIQRAISVLPVDVDPLARFAAESTTTWRLNLWKLLLPEIPKYFWLGKGLSIDAAQLGTITELTENRVTTDPYDAFILTGDYHSGPLSVIIPFGIWGVIGFIWFLIVSGRALHLNYRYGDAYLRNINVFLLASFYSATIVFIFVFGGFYTGLSAFTGLLGLSISLNGGVKRRSTLQAAHEVEPGLKFARFRNRVTATQQN